MGAGSGFGRMRKGRSKAGFFGVLAVAAMAIAASGPARAEPNGGTIVVSGEGEANAAPDVADVTVGVVSEGATAAAALQANSQALSTVLEALKKEGVESRDLQTSGLSVEPRYDPPRNGQPPKTVGYRASNQVSVHVRELAKLGSLLDKAVASGANDVRGVVFGLSDPKAMQDAARRAAMADAQRKAALYADAGAVKLGALRNVEEDGPGFPQPKVFATRMAAPADAAPPVEAGELSVRARIRVTYAIGD